MKTPQSGIFNEKVSHFYFLEYQVHHQGDARSALLRALEQVSSSLEIVISFGADYWSVLQPNWQPEAFQNFAPLVSPKNHQAKATQADVFFWILGENISDVFDQALHIQNQMNSVANLTLEERGFHYHDSLDLIGFEDGTANPKTDELKYQAAIIPQDKPGAGGALVLSQKWLHNLNKWNGIPVHCQEAIVGRTKFENEELEGDAMPADSHVSKTDLKVDGVAMKIYRRSAPFGGVQQNGLFFLAFACEMQRFTSQLESMYGLTDDQTTDQLLDFSEAVSGSYWFAPSTEDLEALLNKA